MTDSLLGPPDFGAFFKAVHGHRPFAWQQDLVDEIAGARAGVWPRLLDLPTGSGKTAVLDIAVFLLALDAAHASAVRLAPRRIILVVDRRIVVDQAATRAERIAERLAHPDEPVLRQVATALGHYRVGEGPPLLTASLRGGVVRDPAWALRPDVPTIVTSTVDQVGSRLLFRGYGESDVMRPVHAGLLGADCLFLLDEVHLSQPFAQTLRAVDSFQSWAEQPPGTRRWQVVELSATPGKDATDRFPSDPLALDHDPVLARRIRAHKPVRLEPVKQAKDEDKAQAQVVTAAARAAVGLLDFPQARVVGVIVNRVATARSVAAALPRLLPDDVDVALLTGRMRPLDREQHLQNLLPRVELGRSRDQGGRRLVLVATQCLEAGADLDLDGLVTECASLDALRQRFGRVDRDGLLSAAGTPAPGVVLGPARLVASDAEDAVYGNAAAATWSWLRQRPDLDLGIAALELPATDVLTDLVTTRPDAPVLLPGHLDSWVQTFPRPTPDPDVSRWLHGLVDTEVEVNVVWRADVSRALLQHWQAQDSGQDVEPVLLESCPPSSLETLGVPLRAVRSWLRHSPVQSPVADVEGTIVPEQAEARPPDRPDPNLVLVWRGRTSRIVDAASLRPGDTVVVPASYGGLSDGSWDPTATAPVTDAGTAASWRSRDRAILRFAPDLWPSRDQVLHQTNPSAEKELEPVDRADQPKIVSVPTPGEDGDDDRRRVAQWLLAASRRGTDDLDTDSPDADGLGPDALDPDVRAVVEHLAGLPEHQLRVRRLAAALGDDKVGPILVVTAAARRTRSTGNLGASTGLVDMDTETSSFLSSQATLHDHCLGVGGLAERFALRCGLSDAVAGDVKLAGELHDLGKADPRFQVWMHEGDEVSAAVAPALLAKSGTPPQDAAARTAARHRSGYPAGARHELLSLALLRDAPLERWGATDVDLVRYLVASHHGEARPFVSLVPDDDPRDVTVEVRGEELHANTAHGLERLDSGLAELFWKLVRRYGWWQLASLEAVLRLADHRRSQLEDGHG